LRFAEIGEFQRITDGLVTVVNKLQKQVEKEKMAAIGARNLVKSVTKQKEGQHQQLQVSLILTKFLAISEVRFGRDNRCIMDSADFFLFLNFLAFRVLFI
jgi:intraflagellar transport protein 20